MTLTTSTSHPSTGRSGPRSPALIALATLVPEIGLGLLLFAAARDQIRGRLGEDRERGDAVQWVILAAVGAVIAVTVGTIVYNKVTNKANTISTDTPAAGQ